MEVMRQSWTDEKLDAGFNSVDGELRAIRGEMRSFRTETNARFDRFEDRFDRWQRMLFQLGAGMLVAMMGIIATLIAKL